MGFIHKGYNGEHTGQWSVASVKLTELLTLRGPGYYTTDV